MVEQTPASSSPGFWAGLRHSVQEARRRLPERVLQQVRSQQGRTECLIGWVQLFIVAVFAVLYAVAPKTFSAYDTFQPVPFALSAYFVFTIFRLALAYRMYLPDWFLYASIFVDITLLFSLIWSFHLQYQQPPAFYLKDPSLIYIFIFIALRALRFEARFVIAAGGAAAIGWLLMLGYAIAADAREDVITRDYVHYMTSNTVLLGAEFAKVISIAMVTAILAAAIVRARALLVTSVAESAAARDLSRFFPPEVAKRIVDAEEIGIGSGESRNAAILNIDLRGFTPLAEAHSPDDVMRLLADYQALMVPIVRKHGGSIDKFLGDGIMATFGATREHETYAADALRCLEEIIPAAERWRSQLDVDGRPCCAVNAAVAAGRVVFGAVGDKDRLEYTVIGEPVNLSAKLEKHNAKANTRALTTSATFELARKQGFAPRGACQPVRAQSVAGVGQPLDLIALG